MFPGRVDVRRVWGHGELLTMWCGLHRVLWPFCLQTSDLIRKFVINVPKLKSKLRKMESVAFPPFLKTEA